MQKRGQTYFFGRLNLLGGRTDKTKGQLLKDSFDADISQTEGIFKYGIFNSRDITRGNNVFAFGTLVKYKPLLEGEIVDERSHEVVEGGLPHGVVAKSDFFLHYRTTVLAYRPVTHRLSAFQFRKMFGALVEAANENFFIQAEVQSIDEEFEINEAIRRFQIISRISFDIHPTNPSNRQVYQHIDERLRTLRVQRMRQVIFAEKDGLNKNALENDDIYKGLVMAIDGYGKGTVEGTYQGRWAKVSTGDSPIRKEVVYSDNPIEVLDQLMPLFEQIWDRMTK